MKKQLLLVASSILALTAMSGCDNNNGASLKEVEAALEAAKGTVNFSGKMNSIDIDEGESDAEGTFDITITDAFFEWEKTYEDYSGASINYKYALEKDSDGYMYYKKLTLMNQVVDQKFINPGSKKEMLYDDYCYNPINELELDDFEIIDGRYFLKEGRASAFNGMMSLCSTTMFHYYECEVSSASFVIQNGVFKSVKLTTKPQSNGYYNPTDFVYDANFDILFPGEVELTPVTAKKHRDEHDTLQSALNSLQEKIATKNYTINVDDTEDGGSFHSAYKVYATDKGFLSSFRPLIYPYVEGFDEMSDGTYRKYYLYIYDSKNVQTGAIEHTKGDKVLVNETSSNYAVARDELDLNFKAFAPEFFLKTGSTFSTTNVDVVEQIALLTAPFTESRDGYLTPSKVFFNLDSNNQITSWGFKMFDYYSGYADTLTYTISDVGETSLPTAEEIYKAEQESSEE